MSPALPFPIRQECPPGACACERDALLNDPTADITILRLTREEEKILIAHIERATTYADLLRIAERMRTQLGIDLTMAPGPREVRSVRGLQIRLAERPGLCLKTRTAIPAAIRRCLEKNRDIVHAILNQHDLFGAD